MEKLNENFIINLSNNKGESLWMKNFRLNSYKKFLELDNPSFGPKINIDWGVWADINVYINSNIWK